MRWEDERYVRFYTRNTPEWLALSWRARGLMGLILRECDRAGVIRVGKLGLKGVAVAVSAPWAEIEGPLAELIEDGCVRFDPDIGALFVPNYLEAQEATQTDAARKRASRERARATFGGSSSVSALTASVTNRDHIESRSVTKSHAESRGVTRGHAESHAVTFGHSVPSLTVPNQAKPDTDAESQNATPHEPDPWGLSPSPSAPESGVPVPGQEGVKNAPAEPASYPGQGETLEVAPKAIQAPKRKRPSAKLSPEVSAMWEYYLTCRNMSGKRFGLTPVCTEARRSHIAARLAEVGADVVKQAIEGLWRSTWHIDNGFTAPEYVFRSAEQLEKCLAIGARMPNAYPARTASGAPIIQHAATEKPPPTEAEKAQQKADDEEYMRLCTELRAEQGPSLPF